MNRILSFIFGVAFIFSGETEGDIGFRYGFLSKPSHESNDIAVLSDSSIIHTGDFLNINIGYLKETNICVIYKGAGGEFMLMKNRETSENINTQSLQDTIYFRAWGWGEMQLPPGIETFYFINTTESLSDLVTTLGRYDKAPPKGQEKLAKRIQEKIDSFDPDVQDDLSSISSNLDKPVVGGVAFRGDDDGLKDLSVTHECLGTGGIAFKKIVLIHK